MPTCDHRPERTGQDFAEQKRLRVWQFADPLAERPGESLPQSAQQFESAEMLKWIDLCA
jgi:hypothetical protein